MTAAQKENIKRFKAVQAEAKKLKAKNKKLTHQEAVKQAWAIMYSKKRSGKKVGYSKERTKVLVRATPYIKKYRAKGWSKEDAIRNANIDAAFMSGTKKKSKRKPTEKDILKKVHSAKTTSKTLYNKLDKLDEAQHKHMGAVNKLAHKDFTEVLNKLNKAEIYLQHHYKAIKNKKLLDSVRLQLKKQVPTLKKYIAELKKQKSELKKLM